jgi:heme/copper-type cytochrome/quinol oxidase subunit 4
MSSDHFDQEIKKLRAKERLLGVALAVIPLTATVLYFLFSDRVQDSTGRHLLAAMVVIEWLVLLVIYLSVVSRMRRRR